ncbi:hypothetical protein HaLaN_02556 [Haematococcus lacustris]|uniref:Uncharacterized protein n=1 Tax=Haematococcus lacustris TaxID=44745 RepID=A0A699YLC3_HAELA|nr:hypothetical protein HaLaN_02556 [Haematococcus lacustris]
MLQDCVACPSCHHGGDGGDYYLLQELFDVVVGLGHLLGCLAFLEVALARAKEPHGKAPCTTAPLALEKHERAQQHKRELLHARFPVKA